MPNLHTLSLTFDLPLRSHEIPHFRGALAAFLGKEEELFHNHDNIDGDGSPKQGEYPRIQYRVHGQQASLFGFAEGAQRLSELERQGVFKRFRVNGKNVPLKVAERRESNPFELKLTPKKQMQRYRLYHWIALNPDNYKQYCNLFSMAEKLQLLEKLLANHLIEFAKAVQWKWPVNRRLEVVINDLDRVEKVKAVDWDNMAFDIVFSTNALLPDRLGIGNHKAYGFGWMYRMD